MNFDINKVLGDMLAAMKNSLSDNWDEVQGPAKQFLENKKERLKLLSELRISGDLSQEKFESRLEDEKLILEAELNALAVVSKAIAQKAVNAAMDVLSRAVKAAIDIIL